MNIEFIIFCVLSSIAFLSSLKRLVNGKVTLIDLFVIANTIYLNLGIFYARLANTLIVPDSLILSLSASSLILYIGANLSRSYLLTPLSRIDSLRGKQFKKHILYINTFLVVLMVSYFLINGIPVLSNNVEMARVNAFNNTKALYYVFLIFAPLHFVYNYFFSNKLVTHAYFITIMFLAFLTGFRSLIFSYIMIYLICLVTKKINIKVSLIAGFFSLTLTIGLILTYLRLPVGHRSVYVAFDVLIDRLFMVNVLNLVDIERYFKTHGFLYGKTILWDVPYIRRSMEFIGVISGSDTFAIWITSKLNPYFSRNFIMTPTIYGISFANFGIFGPPIWSVIITIFNSFLEKIKTSTYLFPFYIYSVSLAFPFFTRGFFSVISLMFIPGLIFAITFERWIFKIYCNKNIYRFNRIKHTCCMFEKN